jgi:cytochrome oxidase Cu insertion factor (SCO1/SenC/PrrC family)
LQRRAPAVEAFHGRLIMKLLVALLSASCALSLAAVAGETEGALEVGGVAPAFSLIGSDGKTHELAELKGKAVVMAWFPKAFTGG